MTIVNSYIIGIIISLQTICFCILSIVGQYIYAFYLQTYPFSLNETLNGTDSVNILKTINKNKTKCVNSDISPDNAAQAWAQQQSADLFFWINLWSSCPIIIMTYILGLYTPQLGKRFVLILTMLGNTIQLVIWLLIIYFLLKEYWWYIAAFITGLSGSDSVRNFVLNLIITENTTENERSSRFVLFGALTMIISSLATFGTGYYIAWRGYTDLFWTCLLLELVSIFIVIRYFKTNQFNQKRLSSSEETNSFLLSSTNTTDVKTFENNGNHCLNICTVFRFKNRSRKKSISLILTLLAYAFYSFICTSYTVFLWFLLNVPFCWTSKDIGHLLAIASIFSGILSIFGMKILTYFGANDIIICIISHICFFIVSIWVSFAQYNWELYGGSLIYSFSNYQGILTISMMSKWLEPYERSNAFTFVTEINTITTVFGTSFFNWVYARTVINYRNFTYLFTAGLSIIPFILNLCLFLVTRKMSEEDLPPLSETDIELLCLPNNVPPHAVDAVCIVIPSRSLTSSLRTPISDRSRTNSIDTNETEETLNSSTNDLV